MKKYLCLVGVILAVNFNALAQSKNVGIGTSAPNEKAILEISSQSKGLLIPRLEQTDRDGMLGLSPTDAGLLIYHKDDHLFNFWKGTGWEKIETSTAIAVGSHWFDGYGLPTDAKQPTAKDGDFYLDHISGKVFAKEQGAWGATTVDLTGELELINKIEYGRLPLPNDIVIPGNDANGVGHFTIEVELRIAGIKDGDMAFASINEDLPPSLYIANANVYISSINNLWVAGILIMNNSSQAQTIPKGFIFNIGIIKKP